MDLDYTGTNSVMVLEVPLGAVDRPSHMPLDFLHVLARADSHHSLRASECCGIEKVSVSARLADRYYGQSLADSYYSEVRQHSININANTLR